MIFAVCCALTIVEVMILTTGGLSDMPVDIRAVAVSLACIFPHGVSDGKALLTRMRICSIFARSSCRVSLAPVRVLSLMISGPKKYCMADWTAICPACLGNWNLAMMECTVQPGEVGGVGVGGGEALLFGEIGGVGVCRRGGFALRGGRRIWGWRWGVFAFRGGRRGWGWRRCLVEVDVEGAALPPSDSGRCFFVAGPVSSSSSPPCCSSTHFHTLPLLLGFPFAGQRTSASSRSPMMRPVLITVFVGTSEALPSQRFELFECNNMCTRIAYYNINFVHVSSLC